MDGRQIWNVMRCVLSLKRTKINLELKVSIIIMRHLKLKSLFHETKGQFHQDRFYCIVEIFNVQKFKKIMVSGTFLTHSQNFRNFCLNIQIKYISIKKDIAD